MAASIGLVEVRILNFGLLLLSYLFSVFIGFTADCIVLMMAWISNSLAFNASAQSGQHLCHSLSVK